MPRYLSAFGAATVTTICLFYLMQFLISGKLSHTTSSDRGNTIEIVRLKRAEDIITKQRKLPDPPKKPVAPTTPAKLATTTNKPDITTPKFNLPLPGIPSLQFNRNLLAGISAEAASPAESSEVIALLKIEPKYPRKAARQGIEGWVKLEFTVLEDGSVADVKILDAEPKRIFDKSAKRAILRWKFKPRVIDGKAVKQQAVQVIEFKLNK